jgi:hypothetical protein
VLPPNFCAKAEFAQFLLGDANDLSSKNRPFIWDSESVYDYPDAEQRVTFAYVYVFVMLMIDHREIQSRSTGLLEHFSNTSE